MPSCHIHTYTKIEANRALVLRNPMAERAKGRPSDALSVMVIDEDEFHANSAKSMLSELNYYVAVYTSPIEALGILEKKAHDVDFIMAAVDMEELNGFQFLEAAKDMHRNLQVIMMSTETTIYTMKRSIQLGALFWRRSLLMLIPFTICGNILM
nr:two-component response regulator ORR29-like [Aegilops tauschii subsp. strangulata]